MAVLFRCIVFVVRIKVMLEEISRFIIGIGTPLPNVAGHIIKTVLIGFIGTNRSCCNPAVNSIVSPQGLEVCEVASFTVTCIQSSPGVHGIIQSTTCGVFPFRLQGQAVILNISITILAQCIVQQLGPPGTKCGCLFPGYPYYRVIVKRRMPEIHICHWLVIGIGKIPDPTKGVRINIDHVLEDECTAVINRLLISFGIDNATGVSTWFLVEITDIFQVCILIFIPMLGGLLKVNPEIPVIQFMNIDFFAAEKSVLHTVIEQVHGLNGIFIVIQPFHVKLAVPVQLVGTTENVLFIVITHSIHGDPVIILQYFTEKFPQERIPYPHHKLPVFIIGDFRLIHPKRFSCDRFRKMVLRERNILIAGPNIIASLWNKLHPKRIRLEIFLPARYSCEFSAIVFPTTAKHSH